MNDSSSYQILYRSLEDEELLRLARMDLVEPARTELFSELEVRGLQQDSAVAAVAGSGRQGSAATSGGPVPEPWVGFPALLLAFRIVVASSFVLGLLIWGIELLPAWMREAPVAATLPLYWNEPTRFPTHVVWILNCLMYGSASVGLFFLRWWGRPLLLLAILVSLVNLFFSGSVAYFRWEVILVTLATMLDGATLCMAYLPPLSRYFGINVRRDRCGR